jgi:DNA topoisomerase-1
LHAVKLLADMPTPSSTKAAVNRGIVSVCKQVSTALGNTPAICRKSYVHPIVVARYLDAGETIAPEAARVSSRRSPASHSAEERALILFLDRHFPERRRRRRPDDLAAA